MSKQLPSRPNLEHLKKQARQLLQDHQAGKLNAVLRLRTMLPRFKALSDQAIRDAALGLRDAQHVIALEYGAESWQTLSEAVEKAKPKRQSSVACSFCHRPVDQVNKVITGPSVHICNECVDFGIAVHADTAPEGWSLTSDRKCSFCGKEANREYTDRLPQGGHTTTVVQVAAREGVEKNICNKCIDLCTEVLAEEAQATDVNAPDEHGMTSLMHSVFKGNIRAVEEFLKRGPNIHHKDHQGRTALDIAINEGHEQIVQLLS